MGLFYYNKYLLFAITHFYSIVINYNDRVIYIINFTALFIKVAGNQLYKILN